MREQRPDQNETEGEAAGCNNDARQLFKAGAFGSEAGHPVLKHKPQPGLNEDDIARWVAETEKLLSDKAIAELDIVCPLIPGADDRDEAGEINKQ